MKKQAPSNFNWTISKDSHWRKS